ncbi:IPT/TIG domain-containing protein [Flagellimonas algicola]|nr:IPT/TIG domain-containing protein [Allomuricauda algicola]
MKKLYFLLMCIAAFLFLSCRNDDGSLPINDTPDDVIENPETDIFDFSPALGGWGTKVTIRGENFDPLPEGNEVQFNGRMAEVESASETPLIAIVPEDATTGKIKLSANGNDYTSFQDFTVLLPPPIISDFEPKEGVEGDEVTITGQHFGTDASAVVVLFHGSDPVEIKSISDTELVVLVPDAFTGPIQMGVKDQYTISNNDFTYLSWRQRKDFEHEPRRFGIAEAIGEDIYMGLGVGPLGNLSDFWKYNTRTDTWTQMPDFLGTPRHGTSHFVLDGNLFVGLGMDGNGVNGITDFYKFEPDTKTWVQLEDFPGNPNQVRQFANSFVLNGKAYVYGGTDIGIEGYYNDLWEYDLASDTWEEKTSFELIGRAGAVAFTIGNKGYIATGYNGQPQWLSDIWEYDSDLTLG